MQIAARDLFQVIYYWRRKFLTDLPIALRRQEKTAKGQKHYLLRCYLMLNTPGKMEKDSWYILHLKIIISSM